MFILKLIGWIGLILFGIYLIGSVKERDKQGVLIGIVVIIVSIGLIRVGTNHKTQATYENYVGGKFHKSLAKKDDSGLFYVDKDDDKIRYFVSDGKITAIKVVYRPALTFTSVISELSGGVIIDKNLKYTNDKVPGDEVYHMEDKFNVYSPKHKRWYRVSVQKNGDRISQFTVWPGKGTEYDY